MADRPATPSRTGRRPRAHGRPPPRTLGDGAISVTDLADALRAALAGRSACLARVPLGWSGSDWSFADPLDYLGQDGGAGLGSGPGMAVGVALALKDSERIAVAVLGDGDFLMGATALWTAARYRLPLLVVVANNRSFLNDEIHQERVARPARARSRTAGSASRSATPIPTSRRSRARSGWAASALWRRGPN